MNKATGMLLFLLPLTLAFIDLKYSGVFVSAVATFAAIQEGHLIRTGMQHTDPAYTVTAKPAAKEMFDFMMYHTYHNIAGIFSVLLYKKHKAN